MTALAGVVGDRPREILESLCALSLQRQRRFGRDAPSVACMGAASFGLSLLPTVPEDVFDRQPLGDGRYLLVADVRLDNRDEILGALNLGAADFRQKADSSILFEALRAWGDAALDRVLGGYAFAFYDAHERRLLLARDPAGEKPLHYAWRDNLFCFASMPGGLVDPPRPQLDLEMLAQRLASPSPLTGTTCFQGVHSVRAGHQLALSSSRLSETDFWRPRLGSPADASQDLVDEFRHLLDAAVSARLRTSSPVIASQLSSGYDSSAVTATAGGLVEQQRLLAITAVPAPGLQQLIPMNRIGDESGYAALTAAMHGIEHVVVHDGSPLLSPLTAASGYFQEPIGNVLNVGWWLTVLKAARARDATVLLCGIMGNFSLSYGGITVLPHLVGGGHWRSWWREARASVANNRNRWRGVLMASFEPHLPAGIVAALRRKGLGSPPPDLYSFVRAGLAGRATTTDPNRCTDLHRTQLNGFRKFDPGMSNKSLLALTGVDQREPTSDRRFTEFCLTLPVDQLLCDGVFRPLARSALSDRVPPEVLNLPVRGYQGADWFARIDRAQVEPLMEEICASSTATALLDTAKMRQAIDGWPSPGRDNYETIFAFGRALSNALAAGKFVADIERDPTLLGD